MPDLDNLTSFAAVDFLSMTPEGADAIVVLLSAQFHLPEPKSDPSRPLVPVDEPPDPPMEDVYHGAPDRSSLVVEGQTACGRAGTDVYVTGKATAPGSAPVTELIVRVGVGPCRKELLVVGDRQWENRLTGLWASPPEPFVTMPLAYEHSFGGSTTSLFGRPLFEPRNPVGRGLHASRQDAAGRQLPNLEDPADRIARWSDRPSPTGLGPIARSWEPRRSLAGTFDEVWVEERAPLWPVDFDATFFHAASPGLVAPSPLQGGEAVILDGLHPGGRIACRLPRRRFLVTAAFRDRTDRRTMRLDGVWIQTTPPTVTLFWRAAIPAVGRLSQHRQTVVRELRSWEDDGPFAPPDPAGGDGSPST